MRPWKQTISDLSRFLRPFRLETIRQRIIARSRAASARSDATRSWEQTISNLLRAVRLENIRRKIIAFSLLATLIPSLTMGWFLYARSELILAEKTSAQLRGATTHTAREVSLWLRERWYETRVFSNSYEVTENLQKSLQADGHAQAVRRLGHYLKSVRGYLADYEELLVTDPNLHVIATSTARSSAIHLPPDWQNLAKTDAQVVSEPYWDEQRNTGVMMLGAPVRSSNGGLLGMLVAKLNLRTLEDHLKGSPVASTGQVYLIDADGSLIIASGPIPSAFMKTKLDGTIVRSLFEQEGSLLKYRSYGGKEVLGTLNRISLPKWAVVAEITQERAFAQVVESRNLTILIVSVLLLGIGLMAYVLGLTIVRPLGRLAHGAADVAAGDLEVDLPVVSGGEMGYVTRIFNDMVKRLRQGRDDLAFTNTTLIEKNRVLETLSVTDSLTGLYNRRRLMETLVHETSRARRYEHSFSLLMLDLDDFKQYNDTLGHVAGDRLLTKVASIFREMVRAMDYAARYGGEEFTIVLPESSPEQARQAAERIRLGVERGTADGEPGTRGVTVSIGVSSFPEHGDTPVALIMSADAALYEAKQAGRNQVIMATGKPTRQAPAS